MISDNLKKSFYGYSKESVYEYIAELNEEFSERVLKNDAEHNARIRSLEETINQLKNENLELKRRESAITSALIEAQQYAKALKIQALKAHKEQVKDTEEKHAEARARINAIMEDITGFEKDIAASLEKIKADLQAFETKSDAINENLEDTTAVIDDLKKIDSGEYVIKKAEEKAEIKMEAKSEPAEEVKAVPRQEAPVQEVPRKAEPAAPARTPLTIKPRKATVLD